MTKEELNKIASSKPILSDGDCEDIMDNEIKSICDEVYMRFLKLSQDSEYDNILNKESSKIAAARINEAENSDDWMSLDDFNKELENEIRSMYK